MALKGSVVHSSVNWSLPDKDSRDIAHVFAGALLRSLGAFSARTQAAECGIVQRGLPFGFGDRVVGLSAADKATIHDLLGQGLMVYYVIPSAWDLYGRLIEEICYLVAPVNLDQAAFGEYASALSPGERASALSLWVNRELEAATRGQVMAYVFNRESDVGNFTPVTVKVVQGALVRHLS